MIVYYESPSMTYVLICFVFLFCWLMLEWHVYILRKTWSCFWYIADTQWRCTVVLQFIVPTQTQFSSCQLFCPTSIQIIIIKYLFKNHCWLFDLKFFHEHWKHWLYANSNIIHFTMYAIQKYQFTILEEK